MIVNNNMAALHTLNTLNKAQMPLNEHSALERLGERNRRWHVGQYGLG